MGGGGNGPVVASAMATSSSSSNNNNKSNKAMMVPERMMVTTHMKKQNWNKVPLVPIRLTPPDGVQEEEPSIKAKDVIDHTKGPAGSIAFVVRRPG